MVLLPIWKGLTASLHSSNWFWEAQSWSGLISGLKLGFAIMDNRVNPSQLLLNISSAWRQCNVKRIFSNLTASIWANCHLSSALLISCKYSSPPTYQSTSQSTLETNCLSNGRSWKQKERHLFGAGRNSSAFLYILWSMSPKTCACSLTLQNRGLPSRVGTATSEHKTNQFSTATAMQIAQQKAPAVTTCGAHKIRGLNLCLLLGYGCNVTQLSLVPAALQAHSSLTVFNGLAVRAQTYCWMPCLLSSLSLSSLSYCKDKGDHWRASSWNCKLF